MRKVAVGTSVTYLAHVVPDGKVHFGNYPKITDVIAEETPSPAVLSFGLKCYLAKLLNIQILLIIKIELL